MESQRHDPPKFEAENPKSMHSLDNATLTQCCSKKTKIQHDNSQKSMHPPDTSISGLFHSLSPEMKVSAGTLSPAHSPWPSCPGGVSENNSLHMWQGASLKIFTPSRDFGLSPLSCILLSQSVSLLSAPLRCCTTTRCTRCSSNIREISAAR